MTFTYKKNLNSNFHVRLALFNQMLKDGITDGKPKTKQFECHDTHHQTVVTVHFEPSSMVLYFIWDDTNHVQQINSIKILQRRSNLPSRKDSKVFYFVCPLTGGKCRKLFLIGDVWRCRKSFYHTYSCQMQSHNERTMMFRESPERKHGKMYYKGNLTPYGKRVIKAWDYDDRCLELWEKALINELN